MRLLIAPRSRMPVRIKALIRWMIVKAGKDWKLFEYDDGCDIPGWQGWLEWRGMCICFVDTDGNDHYRW